MEQMSFKYRHLLREGGHAVWTERKRAAQSSQRQRLHSLRAPCRCHGNTTYAASVSAHAEEPCEHAYTLTHRVGQQLVTLLQTTGGCGKDVMLVRSQPHCSRIGWSAPILHTEVCVHVSVYVCVNVSV